MELCSLDSRYRGVTEPLRGYFSEYAFMKYRYKISISYLKMIISEISDETSMPDFPEFDMDAFERIKEIEKETDHDMASLVIYIQSMIDDDELAALVHFGSTSQDINGTALVLSLKEYYNDLFIPRIGTLISFLERLSDHWKDIPMMGRTHGQPASGTRLGKEIDVFRYRLRACLQKIEWVTKFGGAVGNLNAHYIAYPNISWDLRISEWLLGEWGLERVHLSTQIGGYDELGRLFDNMKRINCILIDLCQDMWQYISMGYLVQRSKESEVGSSTMPHKINPIKFENAEGNLGLSNSLFEFMTRKLPVSRLQRDLSDVTVTRNIGVAFGYQYLAIYNVIRGLLPLEPNRDKMMDDLIQHPEIVTEAIQTILQAEGYVDAYNQLKLYARDNKITLEGLHEFIDTMQVSEELKNRLKTIRPETYLGK